jgi:hypothetical protein
MTSSMEQLALFEIYRGMKYHSAIACKHLHLAKSLLFQLHGPNSFHHSDDQVGLVQPGPQILGATMEWTEYASQLLRTILSLA